MTIRKVSKEDREKCKLVTPEFRAAYPHLFRPSAIENSAPKYSVTGLFPKTTDLSAIQKAMTSAKVAAFGPDKSKWPKITTPVTDGDSPKYEGKEGYKGHWVIKFSTKEENKPTVVDKDLQPIIDPTKFYPGCYARASIYAYVWEFGGKCGLSFILDHVQKIRDGKSFGGRKSAEQVFTPINSGEDDMTGDGGDFSGAGNENEEVENFI